MAKGSTFKVNGRTFYFPVEGDRSKDLLMFNSGASTTMGNMDGTTRIYEKGEGWNNRLQNGTEKTDISAGVGVVITLNDGIGTIEATQTLGHESFVHGEASANLLKTIKKMLSEGKYYGKEQLYIRDLQKVDSNGDEEHSVLGNNGNEKYLNYCNELDKQNGTKKYTDEYNREREEYKKK